jgi:hypothetical protein
MSKSTILVLSAGLLYLLAISLILSSVYSSPLDDSHDELLRPLQSEVLNWANQMTFGHVGWLLGIVTAYFTLVTKLKRHAYVMCDFFLLLTLGLLSTFGAYVLLRTFFYVNVSRTALWLEPFQNQSKMWVWAPQNHDKVTMGTPPPFTNGNMTYYSKGESSQSVPRVNWTEVFHKDDLWYDNGNCTGEPIPWQTFELPSGLTYLYIVESVAANYTALRVASSLGVGYVATRSMFTGGTFSLRSYGLAFLSALLLTLFTYHGVMLLAEEDRKKKGEDPLWDAVYVELVWILFLSVSVGFEELFRSWPLVVEALILVGWTTWYLHFRSRQSPSTQSKACLELP